MTYGFVRIDTNGASENRASKESRQTVTQTDGVACLADLRDHGSNNLLTPMWLIVVFVLDRVIHDESVLVRPNKQPKVSVCWVAGLYRIEPLHNKSVS